ncbi:MAG: glutathione S-transferase family protein, partial [Chromatiaceae bacterium]|nr:glutathione S-transferase family protein [Chromatiaceae bacterium]
MHHTDNGEFIRWESGFRHWVTPDGSPGPSGEGGFPAEPGRYHLYVSHACPWAHRTLIVRALKRLEELISVSVVHPLMPAESWVFGEYPGATPDHVHGFDKLQQLYQHSASDFDGVVTVPVLYDKQRQTIVNNESAEIIRMLNSAFDAWGNAELDLYPVELRAEIDAINALVYDNINNGVYRAGFATTQAAYEDAFDKLFATLDQLEERLAT